MSVCPVLEPRHSAFLADWDHIRREIMRFARSQIIFWSTLLLLLLQGCASTPAQPSPTHAGITSTSTIPPTPSSPVNSYRPNDHDPFQANFNERAPFTTCPSSSKPTDVCFKVSGTGTSIPYGS